MARDSDGGSDGGEDSGADASAESDGSGDAQEENAVEQSPASGDGRTDAADGRSEDDADGDPLADAADADTRAVSSSRHTSPEPDVSVTIEGSYESVFERIEHPKVSQHSELDTIVAHVEETLQAVLRTGGGIRSEIYDATEFELEDPWEIRKYLEVLAMHDLIRLQNDRWVPSDYFEGASREDGD